MRLGARRRRPRPRRDRRRALRPPPRAARVPRGLRPRRSRASATSRPGEHHTAEDAALALGEALDRGARRPPRDRALRRRGRADGRRARPRGRRPRRPAGGRAAARARPRARRAHAAEPRAGRHGSRSTSRRPAATTHHVAEAAFKAVGRALRAAVRVEGAGVPSTKGVAVNVAVCDYGAGQHALGRDRASRGSAPTRGHVDPTTSPAPTSPCSRASARRASAMAGLRERGLDDALRDARRDGRPDARHLPRPPARARGVARRTAASTGSASCPAVRCACARAASRGSAGREVEPRGEAFYFAHSYAAETPRRDRVVGRHRRRSRERGAFLGVQFHPEKSGAAGARFLGAMPLPRLIPCLDVAGGRVVKGVRFEGLRDVGDPVELGARVLRRGRGRARLPRREGDARGARARCVELVAPRRRAARDPVHGRRRRPHASPTPRRCSRRARTRSRSTRAALERPELDRPSSPSGSARRPSSSRSTPTDGRGALARRHDATGRDARSSGRARREERGAGEILLTSIDADGTRDGYDLELTRARSRTRSRFR